MQPIELLDMRRKAKMSQADLGKAIGYSRQAVIKWERGNVPIPQNIVPKLIAACVAKPAAPAPKDKALINATVDAYVEMRKDFPHAAIIKRWIDAGFTPHEEAQKQILELFPDILAKGN